MKCLKTVKIVLVCLGFCLSSTLCSASSGLSSTGNGIMSDANKRLIQEINQPLPFVNSVWTSLAGHNSIGAGFAAADQYKVSNTILSPGTTITNSNNGTLDVCYGPNASGPLANKCYSLAPTRVTLRGNTFYVYEVVKCFTNIIDSLTSAKAPPLNTPSNLMNSSDLGVVCLYAEDPHTAAIAVVLGTNITSLQSSNPVL